MPSIADKIRADYREAVASAIEGKDNAEAWERVRHTLASAIITAFLNGAANVASRLPKQTEKLEFARSNCGAGAEGNTGFQPGNTCAGEGGGAQTSTPEFKRWFGESKVVDESGEPLMVYHGTPEEFSVFTSQTAERQYGPMVVTVETQAHFFTGNSSDAID